MLSSVIYILFGYVCGSVLFAVVAGHLFGKDITGSAADHNPGTANAFMQGGALCGILTLLGDFGKGFLPVWLFLMRVENGRTSLFLPLVLAAPVIGHIFPLFRRFRGGKGIAASFGCFAALLPDPYPLLSLAFFFIFFSLILRITPHIYRTIVTYVCTALLLFFTDSGIPVQIGCCLIALAVVIRLLCSHEERDSFKVHLLWKH